MGRKKGKKNVFFFKNCKIKPKKKKKQKEKKKEEQKRKKRRNIFIKKTMLKYCDEKDTLIRSRQAR